MIKHGKPKWYSLPCTALTLLVVTSCNTPAPARDVLLITIDTARADYFSYVAGGGPGTPRIDALAQQGVGFTQAITAVPLTLPAHASLMTGRQPPSHGVRDNGAYRLPDDETTLAEALSAAGYATAAFVGAQVLEARYGLDQGFGVYDDDMGTAVDSPLLHYAERPAEQVVAAAKRWLETQADEPVFVWVHLFDPHAPYRAPAPHEAGYAGEIAYTDRVVGDLLDTFERRGRLERALVIVTSDHGEGLGEHGESTHGVLVHDATLRVPLVIRAPGITQPQSVADPVHLIDLMPTVLRLLDLPVPPGVRGRDLGPLLRGESLGWRDSSGYAESLYAQRHHGTAALVALRQPGWKLVRGASTELHDLDADPAELQNLAAREPQRVAAISSDLIALIDSLDESNADRVELDEESRRALESLGYAWSSPAPRDAVESLREPREALVSMRLMADADRSFLGDDVRAAIDGYHEVLRAEPDSIDARVRLAQLLLTARRAPEAATLFAEAVRIAPHEPILHRKLGQTFEQLGRFDAALASYDSGLALHPATRELRDGRWRCLNQLRRWDEMLAEAEAAIATDSGDGMARFSRAVACCSQPLAAYVAALERELAELPGDPILSAALAATRAAPR